MLIKKNDDGSFQVLLAYEGQTIGNLKAVVSAKVLDETYLDFKTGKRHFQSELDHPRYKFDPMKQAQAIIDDNLGDPQMEAMERAMTIKLENVCGYITDMLLLRPESIGIDILIGTWKFNGPMKEVAEKCYKETGDVKLSLRAFSNGTGTCNGINVVKVITWDFVDPNEKYKQDLYETLGQEKADSLIRYLNNEPLTQPDNHAD
jgi:hypothetical protein